MNKAFKIIWSKARNCYVVASELAKRHTKSSKSGIIGATTVGLFATLLNFGVANPAFAEPSRPYEMSFSNFTSQYYTVYIGTDHEDDDNYIGVKKSDGSVITGFVNGDTLHYMNSAFTVVTGDNAPTYTAGIGIAVSNNNVISAKAGTGITINSSGISITEGNVAAGNTNAITGGTAYSELRPSANGNYVIFLSPFPEFFL